MQEVCFSLQRHCLKKKYKPETNTDLDGWQDTKMFSEYHKRASEAPYRENYSKCIR